MFKAKYQSIRPNPSFRKIALGLSHTIVLFLNLFLDEKR